MLSNMTEHVITGICFTNAESPVKEHGFYWNIGFNDSSKFQYCCRSGVGLNGQVYDGLFQKRWTFSDNRDFTVCIIRCVYRAELILGTVYLSNKDPGSLS